MPESSSGVISSTVPGRTAAGAAERVARVVGLCCVDFGASAVVLTAARSGRPGRRCGAEAERVVEREDLAVGQHPRLAPDDVEVDVVVGVLEVGGGRRLRSRSARMVAMVSTAPAARAGAGHRLGGRARTGRRRRREGLADRLGLATSPTEVDVAWALMWTTSEGTAPADSMAIAWPAGPRPDRVGLGHVMGVEVMPEPAISA
jgi:hypothetical protein